MAVDPRDLSGTEIENVVKKASEGSKTAIEAKQRIEKEFSASALVWVFDKGAHQFKVFLQPYPGAEHHTIYCRRR